MRLSHEDSEPERERHEVEPVRGAERGARGGARRQHVAHVQRQRRAQREQLEETRAFSSPNWLAAGGNVALEA